jgi:hypothetical protein
MEDDSYGDGQREAAVARCTAVRLDAEDASSWGDVKCEEREQLYHCSESRSLPRRESWLPADEPAQLSAALPREFRRVTVRRLLHRPQLRPDGHVPRATERACSSPLSAPRARGGLCDEDGSLDSRGRGAHKAGSS